MRSRYPLIAILVGVPLGLLAGAIIAEEDGVAAGTATGIATALLTGGIAAGYVAWRDRAWTKWAANICQRYEAEVIVHHGQARLGRSIGIDVGFALVGAWHLLGNGIDGWLVLTKQRLVFQPRSGGNPVQIPVSDIAGARPGNSFVPNTIALTLRDRRSIEIRVQKREEWIDAIATVQGITIRH